MSKQVLALLRSMRIIIMYSSLLRPTGSCICVEPEAGERLHGTLVLLLLDWWVWIWLFRIKEIL